MLMRGGVAQLGERLLRMQEVGGSSPLTSKLNIAYSKNFQIIGPS